MSGSATPLDTISAEWSPDKFRFVESKDKQAPLCKSKCTPSSFIKINVLLLCLKRFPHLETRLLKNLLSPSLREKSYRKLSKSKFKTVTDALNKNDVTIYSSIFRAMTSSFQYISSCVVTFDHL
jgi:hypothetical protein